MEGVRVPSVYPSGFVVVRIRMRMWSKDLPMMVYGTRWALHVRSLTLVVGDPIITSRPQSVGICRTSELSLWFGQSASGVLRVRCQVVTTVPEVKPQWILD